MYKIILYLLIANNNENSDFDIEYIGLSGLNNCFLYLSFINLVLMVVHISYDILLYQYFVILSRLMNPQDYSQISFFQIQQDSKLGQIFELYDQGEQHFYPINHHPSYMQHLEMSHIQVLPEEIEKGYQSDEYYAKMNKQKRIRKKNAVPIREDVNNKKRIKLYIQSLQNRLSDLEAQVQNLRNLNKLNLGYIKKLSDSQRIKDGLFINRLKIFQKLQKEIESQNPDNKIILQQYNTLRSRQGALGTDRLKAVNYYFKQMMQTFLPNPTRYLTESAINNTELFDDDILNKKDKENGYFKILNLNKPKVEMIKLLQNEIIQKRRNYTEKILNIHELKCQILKDVCDIESTFEKLAMAFSPLQVGKFICHIEKYKFQKNESMEDSLKSIYFELQNSEHYESKTELAHAHIQYPSKLE